MKAMILAAGRGERMREMTDHTPKPLLKANHKPLIHYTLEQLANSQISEIVINIAYLGNKIRQNLGNGQNWGVSIEYSDEGDSALETAGGIIKALPLLGDQPFLVINADIAHDVDLLALQPTPIGLAHLVLINNPAHHPDGDFHLGNNNQLNSQEIPKLTYSGIGIYHPKLFVNQPSGKIKLAPILRQAMLQGHITGQHHQGFWLDIGTPERLKQLEQHYQ